jgi:hypothetical protein
MKVGAVVAVAAGLLAPGLALAGATNFDGTWSVQLVGDAGGACGSGSHQTLIVENGVVRGSGASVSGHVAPSGAVSLAVQKGLVQGSVSGKLSGRSGSGGWAVSSLGCSGRWTAQRRMQTVQGN